MTNNFAFEVKVDLCLKYTFTGGDKPILMLISVPVGFELGLGAELGKNDQNKKKGKRENEKKNEREDNVSKKENS